MYRKWSIIKLSTSVFKNLSDFSGIVVCSSASSTSCSASLNTFIYSGSIGPLEGPKVNAENLEVLRHTSFAIFGEK